MPTNSKTQDMAHNLPVNSLEVIGRVPRGVKEHNNIGPYEVKTKTTRPDGTKRQLSADSTTGIVNMKSGKILLMSLLLFD